MDSPKVSVLMPVYNADKYLKDSISSILNQTFTDFELIIIDDGSTDKSWEIIKNFQKIDNRIVAVKNEKNLGIAGNLNKSISFSKGKYLARMDADDWSYPDRFIKQVEALDRNQEIGIIGGSIEVCDNNLNNVYLRKYNHNDFEIRKNIFKYSPFCHPAIMFRREAIINNKYNERLSPTEDYDIYFRIGKNWKFSNLKDNLLKYRNSKNQSSNSQANRQQYLTLYIRLKAIIEYDYKPSIMDIFLSILQLILVPITPNSFKLFLFNYFRKKI
jgi:glycosyltransferase involved in cell wall biosynthesis